MLPAIFYTMRFVTSFVLFFFTSACIKGQDQKKLLKDIGIEQVNPKDPNQWKYKLYPAENISPKDSIHEIGSVSFFSKYAIIVPVVDTDPKLLKRSGIYYAQITFHVFKLQDLSNALRVTKKIRDTSSCQSNQSAGDYFISGNYVFVNMDDCFPCIVQNNTKDMCRPFIQSLFKKIDNKEGLQLKELLLQLPIKESQ